MCIYKNTLRYYTGYPTEQLYRYIVYHDARNNIYICNKSKLAVFLSLKNEKRMMHYIPCFIADIISNNKTHRV